VEVEVSKALQATGGILLIIAGILAMATIPVLFVVGAEWLSTRLLPWFSLASALALAFVLLVALPLSVFKACRRFASVAALISSYMFGATLWMWGLLLTLKLWGWWAVILGLFMAGVGVVPIAMLATLFKGMYSVFGQLILLTVLTFGVRSYALWIVSDAEAAEAN
jgi:hypothetical protein